jgi:hypothetical protein
MLPIIAISDLKLHLKKTSEDKKSSKNLRLAAINID